MRVLLLSVRRAAAFRLALRELGLVGVGLGDRIEIGFIVTDCQVGLAIGGTRKCVARVALIEVDDLVNVTLHDNALVLDHVALCIQRNDVGDAERLARHDKQVAAL